ncbi:hypothetical protein AC481_02005 [miscellaneous Crenarchaeota group archaeon SMTZ-80]|nr:MAG: hypothetical protein AC481_02005 [miscellaneous Crenarchaeota group archaeon SMTZ-80]
MNDTHSNILVYSIYSNDLTFILSYLEIFVKLIHFSNSLHINSIDNINRILYQTKVVRIEYGKIY